MTTDELEQIEKKAFIKHCEIESGNVPEQIENIPILSTQKIALKNSEEIEI